MIGTELITYANGLKSISDMVASILKLGNTAESKQQILELNRVVLAAHESAFRAQAHESALLEENRALKEEIRNMRKWEIEQVRYQLQQFEGGGVAYALKESAKKSDPPHWICAACYEQGRKTIFQRTPAQGRDHSYACAFGHPPLVVTWQTKASYAQ